jgi:hypothetical protein
LHKELVMKQPALVEYVVRIHNKYFSELKHPLATGDEDVD